MFLGAWERGEGLGTLKSEQCLYDDLVSGPKEIYLRKTCPVSELEEAKNRDKILVLATVERFGRTSVYRALRLFVA